MDEVDKAKYNAILLDTKMDNATKLKELEKLLNPQSKVMYYKSGRVYQTTFQSPVQEGVMIRVEWHDSPGTPGDARGPVYCIQFIINGKVSFDIKFDETGFPHTLSDKPGPGRDTWHVPEIIRPPPKGFNDSGLTEVIEEELFEKHIFTIDQWGRKQGTEYTYKKTSKNEKESGRIGLQILNIKEWKNGVQDGHAVYYYGHNLSEHDKRHEVFYENGLHKASISYTMNGAIESFAQLDKNTKFAMLPYSKDKPAEYPE